MFNADQLNSLYRYCFSLTGEEHESYDLLQTGIEKFLNIDNGKVENKSAYIKRIIRNHYIDECRKRSKVDEEQFDETVTYVDMNTDSLEKIVASQYQLEAVWQQLTVSEREIMYFWAVEGYTTDELADFLELPRGTLLSKIHRLRKRLEKQFDESNREVAS
ncbi:MAG: sigma-70 family RNA polymerase sigma factor [Gammaproteobacteria bacterium]|nr:sigma-70 family RNA polymerase sigma factor [Gammaproteobacteria bacterium]